MHVKPQNRLGVEIGVPWVVIWTPSFPPIPRDIAIQLFRALLLRSGSWCLWVRGFLFIGVWQFCD